MRTASQSRHDVVIVGAAWRLETSIIPEGVRS
jgi:hypothetical protein